VISRDRIVDYWWSQRGVPLVVTVEDTDTGREAFIYSADRSFKLGGDPRFPQIAVIAANVTVGAPPPIGMADIFDPVWEPL
jgi:hypothetical protein